ncbi:hypothetical protein ASH00_14355 [Arthrobacter sp. Soil782]|uniref:glycosyltransferase n=1 Tax=Arthrobacter sp. Soil782 TaxID=1736410 RepID=UPI0006FFFA14|nr:glycosyltransferase [Arthrobacter sp. Soil782]KRF04285.1 hypothetical protein ASH00_14355 [Arthrobacter sp. Soil782]
MANRILCISFSDISSDSRVKRQLRILADYGEVTTVSYGTRPDGSTEHLEIDESLASLPQTVGGVLRLATGRFPVDSLEAPAVRQAYALLKDAGRFDLVVANEARALPLAHRVARGTPVWGDMHEWAPEERAHVPIWRLLVKPYMTEVCDRFLPLTAAVTAVNSSIAALYEERFGCNVMVVRNAGPRQELVPSETNSHQIRLVHSGAAIPGRNLECMIDAVHLLDERFTLDLYLVGARDGGRYLRMLRRRAKGSERITFHAPVRPDSLPKVLNAYDVGVFSLPPRTKNHELMLPNKFFDYVQARIAIVFSPAVETSSLIEQYSLGVVAASHTTRALMEALSTLTIDQVRAFKASAHAAAEALSNQRDEQVCRRIVEALIAGGQPRQP